MKFAKSVLVFFFASSAFEAFAACPAGQQAIKIPSFGNIGSGEICVPVADAPAKPVCATVYVGGNLDNAAATIYDMQAWHDIHSGLYARRTWHGGLRQEWSGTDRYWSDISSASVSPGCGLTVSDSADLSGATYPLAGGSNGASYTGGTFPIPARVGSLRCSCDSSGGDIFRPQTGLELIRPVGVL